MNGVKSGQCRHTANVHLEHAVDTAAQVYSKLSLTDSLRGSIKKKIMTKVRLSRPADGIRDD